MFPPGGTPLWNNRPLWHFHPAISRRRLVELKNWCGLKVERLLTDPNGEPVYICVTCNPDGRYFIRILTMKGGSGLAGNVSLYDVCRFLYEHHGIVTIP